MKSSTPINLQLALWLWFTCLFANFAEAMAEGRGKAHADALRKMRTTTMARRFDQGTESAVIATDLKIGNFFVCETGDIIPADGEIVARQNYRLPPVFPVAPPDSNDLER